MKAQVWKDFMLALTKIVGIFEQEAVVLDNTKKITVFDVVSKIITKRGTIKYSYVRDSYEPKKIVTEETSGIFTKGTITKTHVTLDKQIRKIVYISLD